MSPLRQQMIAALHLSGKSERTQESYVREVRLLAQFYCRSPDRITEQELQRLLPAPQKRRRPRASLHAHLLQRYSLLLSARPPTRLVHAVAPARANHPPSPRRPQCEEVRRLLASATPLHNQVYFTAVYSLGLRLHEALSLQVSDIDGQRLQVHVHRGKGAKDRYVPLPAEPLALLRT